MASGRARRDARYFVTVSTAAREVADPHFELPKYRAITVCLPTLSVFDSEIVALPDLSETDL
jgi:hypothetical protein